MEKQVILQLKPCNLTFVFRRRLIATAKATQYRSGAWVPNMYVKEEFTTRAADSTYLKKRTVGPLCKYFDVITIVPKSLQDRPFNSGIPQRAID